MRNIIYLMTTIVAGLFLLYIYSEVNKPIPNMSFKIDIVDSNIIVYDNENQIGVVRLQGELDSLITDYVE